MTRGWRKSAGFAAALPALLLMLALRGLIAPGYMPEFDAQGFRIVVCEDQASPAAVSDHAPAHHEGHDDKDPAASGAVCAFAAVGPELAPDAPPPSPRWPFAVAPAETVLGTGLAPIVGPTEGPPPPARAPPAVI
jgi:hypothetical protein